MIFSLRIVFVFILFLTVTVALPQAYAPVIREGKKHFFNMRTRKGAEEVLNRVSDDRLRGGAISLPGAEGNVTVPTETKWQPSPASEFHDNVNLLLLSVLGFGAVYALIRHDSTVHRMLTLVGFGYIALDTVWLMALPSIVKSPTVVLMHHIATLLVLLDPLQEASHSVYTSACLLVEINTLLLLLRRKVSYHLVVELPFLATWVLLRNIWYPLLMVYFMMCYAPWLRSVLPSIFWDIRSQIEGPSPVGMKLVSMLSWTAVCVFQFKWTAQLFAQHPWFGGKAKKSTNASGPPSPPAAKGYL